MNLDIFDWKYLEEEFNRSKFKRLSNNLLESLKDIGYELDFLNLKENYFISFVLSAILWFLVSLYVFKGFWIRLVVLPTQLLASKASWSCFARAPHSWQKSQPQKQHYEQR